MPFIEVVPEAVHVVAAQVALVEEEAVEGAQQGAAVAAAPGVARRTAFVEAARGSVEVAHVARRLLREGSLEDRVVVVRHDVVALVDEDLVTKHGCIFPGARGCRSGALTNYRPTAATTRTATPPPPQKAKSAHLEAKLSKQIVIGAQTADTPKLCGCIIGDGCRSDLVFRKKSNILQAKIDIRNLC